MREGDTRRLSARHAGDARAQLPDPAALDSGAVVWASSRDIGGSWLNADGTRQPWRHPGGHFACIWRHDAGAFYPKDSSGPACRHDDVPYARGQMEAWLAGAFENRYVIRLAGWAPAPA